MAEASDVNVNLHEKWLILTALVNPDIQKKWWNILCFQYSEPHRKFHTFSHLQHMFLLMDSYINEIQDKTAISFAIFFHDIVYHAKSQENEEESIKMFNEFAEDSGIAENKDLILKVQDLILSAKQCSEEHMVEGLYGKDDVHYFSDFDISYLSSDPTEYLKYTLMIEEEYNFLPKSRYDFMRLKVLQHFLQIPNIYATKAFRDKYEKLARCNIENEIKSLNKNTS